MAMSGCITVNNDRLTALRQCQIGPLALWFNLFLELVAMWSEYDQNIANFTFRR